MKALTTFIFGAYIGAAIALSDDMSLLRRVTCFVLFSAIVYIFDWGITRDCGKPESGA